MPKFKQIIKDYVSHSHFMGEAKLSVAEKVALEKETQLKRATLLDALTIRQKECMMRYKWSVGGVIVGVFALIALILFHDKGMEMIQKLGSVLGGTTLLGLFTYLLSLRDEMTKIKQTVLLATIADATTLNTLMLALSTDIA